MIWRNMLADLVPLGELPITWDSTGYTSETFNKAVGGDAWDGWSGDLSDEEEADVMAELLDVQPGDSLLDVACGYGRHAMLFAEHYDLRVTGVDISPGLIAAARTLADAFGVFSQNAHHARAHRAKPAAPGSLCLFWACRVWRRHGRQPRRRPVVGEDPDTGGGRPSRSHP